MPELKRYLGPDNPFAKTTKVNIDQRDSEFLGRGLGEGTVSRVGVTVLGEGGRTRDIQMAKKIFDHPDYTDATEITNYILSVHARLKELGLPTIPTVRKEISDNSILMTDLTQNGKKEVVSITDWWQRDGRKGKFAETDYKIEISNADQLSESIGRLFDQTVATGCLPAHIDTFFIIIDKTSKEGEVILGDLNLVSFLDMPLALEEQKSLAEYNFSIFEKFITKLKEYTKDDKALSIEPLKKVKQKYLEKS